MLNENKVLFKFVMCTFLLFANANANANANNNGGIGLDVTRVIIPSSAESASLRVNNTSDNDVWLLRTWVSDYGGSNQETPFFITPPITRINQKESIQFRINKLPEAASLPTDRESVFSINVMAIPPRSDNFDKKKGGGIQLAINNKIKLFYRPDSLNNLKQLEKIQERVKVQKSNSIIEVKNPTPYYITLENVKVNDTLMDVGDYMIPPYSSIPFKGHDAYKFSFQIINDYGGLSKVINISL
ncbi:putative chaperone [Escherichia coli]|uniref:fimbrial biogenesis chaperone n=1 Tax=Escherichia coli TaxID=562 RepID=UPI000BE1F78C|nr:molecular chaperone [Escherichia coli]CAD5644479.1 putative chaperone [Escherichia coli]CAD5881764.1 putative chaperone [Escherichia coli]CAD6120942.1 putative chaperone [Escherichia coli]